MGPKLTQAVGFILGVNAILDNRIILTVGAPQERCRYKKSLTKRSSFFLY